MKDRDMATKRKGKIPASEWQAIAARRKAGEALAHIARDYGCTGPAIGYIVNRVAARGGTSTPMQTQPAAPDRPRQGDHPVQASLGEGQHTRTMSPASPDAPDVVKSAKIKVAALDAAILTRITGDIAVFLDALDAVVQAPSRETMDQLSQAADYVMHAAARVRIEIERSSDN